MPKEYAVITAIGTDRIGFVDDIAAMVGSYECNIEESRMSVLGGEFALVMLVSGMESGIIALSNEKNRFIERFEIQLTVKRTPSPHAKPDGRPYIIEAFSLDAPGILHSVTVFLKQYGINIEDMETDAVAAPWTGAKMFHLKAHVSVPTTVQIRKLRDELQQFELNQDLDISIKAVNPA